MMYIINIAKNRLKILKIQGEKLEKLADRNHMFLL